MLPGMEAPGVYRDYRFIIKFYKRLKKYDAATLIISSTISSDATIATFLKSVINDQQISNTWHLTIRQISLMTDQFESSLANLRWKPENRYIESWNFILIRHFESYVVGCYGGYIFHLDDFISSGCWFYNVFIR